MADYAISNVPRRVVYAASGTGPYAFTFEILNQTDIAVYRASTLLTLTTDYTVTINANGTGSVTLVTTAGTSNITIVGSKNIQRTTDFTTGGDLFANTLNDELDNQTIFIQQVAETAERGLKAPVTDPTDIAMTLPAKDGRKGKVLAFDSTTGNPVAGPALDAVVTVIEQSANINTVADNIASVNTVAGNTSNINTVAGVSGSVTTVATSISNVNTVADDLNEAVSEINTVAVNIANVNTVGGISSAVSTVAGISSAVSTVSTNQASVNTVSTNIANVNATGSNIANVNAVGADLLEPTSEINTVAVDIANVNTVGTNIANVNTVAGISANVTSVAGNSTNINTVATNIANVNNVGNNIANVNSVAGNATNINTVAGISANVTTVAGISSNVTTVATNNANVTTVAGSIASVNTNATNIANINQNAANIVAIQNASANATAAASSATAAAGSATSASASAAAASAVALGNEPVRHSIRPSLLLDFANTKTLDPRITFTRASTGTFYDGKTVAKAEENLLLQSQTLENASWGATDVTVTTNDSAAPDGTTTAEKLVEAATTNFHALFQTPPPSIAGTTYAVSVFAKNVDRQFMSLSVSTAASEYAGAKFDLSAGTAGSTSAVGSGWSVTSSSITSIGSGWYRCSLIFVAGTSSTSFRVRIGLATDSTTFGNFGMQSYTGTTNSLLVWGAQLEQRSSVTAYTPTTTAPITNYIPALQTAAAGVARFEHNPVTGESLGLEIEEQRTNLTVYSEQFDNAAWAKTRSSISSNTIIAPDGTLTGDKLVEDTTATNTHVLTQSFTVSASTAYTFSAYLKAAGRANGYLVIYRGDSPFTFLGQVIYDLSAGTISVSSGSGTITQVGNGWYRITVTATSASTSLACRVALRDSSGNDSYTGNGFDGAFIWGAQLEAGAFATSYIPTVASQVTRSADAASMTGTNFSSWYRADAWTMYAEAMNRNGAITGTNFTIYSINDTTSNNEVLSRFLGSSTITQSYGSNGGAANQWAISGASTAVGTHKKIVTAYAINDVAFSDSGATASTDMSALLISNMTQLQIGVERSSSQPLNGTIKKIAYYPKRLTNAEIQGVTTV
jgi:hypothetical protein